MYRIARIEDCEAVYRLICDMEAKTLPRGRFEEIFRAQCEDAHYECLLREEDGRVIGMLNLRYEEQLHHAAAIAEIMELVVEDGSRGKRLGKELFAKACERARERGCVQIEVACNQLRSDAHRFYLREGMKNYHFKFSRDLTGNAPEGNVLGR